LAGHCAAIWCNPIYNISLPEQKIIF